MSFIYCHLNFHANLLRSWRFPLKSYVFKRRYLLAAAVSITLQKKTTNLVTNYLKELERIYMKVFTIINTEYYLVIQSNLYIKGSQGSLKFFPL
jgi:hypothetical protein